MGNSQSHIENPFEYQYIAAPQRLKFLIFSDTHVNTEQMNKFAFWYNENKSSYDFILMPGDFTNIGSSEHTDPIKEREAESQAIATLEFIQRTVKVPVLYIPGNHEPLKMYSNQIQVPGCTNLHKSAALIKDSLVIVGQGGSVPFYRYVNNEYQILWDGFPYKTEEAYMPDLKSTFENAYKIFGDKQYILLSHTGPWDSPTAIMYMQPYGKLWAGSKTQNDLLKKYTSKIMLNIHGHLHTSEGTTKLYSDEQAILNPGAVTSGKFAELNLINTSGKWKIESTKFIDISN